MRITFLNSTIEKCGLHFVGNKVADDGLYLSDSLLELKNDLKNEQKADGMHGIQLFLLHLSGILAAGM